MAVKLTLVPIQASGETLTTDQVLPLDAFCLDSPQELPTISRFIALASDISDRLSALEGNCPALICMDKPPLIEPDACACFDIWGSGVPNPDPNPEPPPLECIQDYVLPDYFAEDYACTPQSPVGPF